MANKVSHQEVSVISKDTIRFHATFLHDKGEAGDGCGIEGGDEGGGTGRGKSGGKGGTEGEGEEGVH